jgi:mono/diheme cytochrome c family protein
MNRYKLITLFALLAFIIILPVYVLSEPQRMAVAQTEYQDQVVREGAELYVELCRLCHGDAGEGVGAMPPLDNPAFGEVDSDKLFRTIARAAHGSEMAAWHIDEGGMLNDYQINELVIFLQKADWTEVARLSQAAGELERIPTGFEVGDAFLEFEPHDCVACHEDPIVHAEVFGIQCERCHNTIAWTPAYLTRHTFALDHGDEGTIACETCHVDNYYTNTCYECHDHQPDQMMEVHLKENLPDYENCYTCHPTGEAGEAARLRDEGLLEVILLELDNLQLVGETSVNISNGKK